MVTTFKNSFIVMPKHCNDMMPTIFGGKFMAELDICAACCVSELLLSSPSPCDNGVTYKFSGQFDKKTINGDIVFLEAEITELRHKAIGVKVKAYRKPRRGPAQDPEYVGMAEFVFISRIGETITPHSLNNDMLLDKVTATLEDPK